MTSKSERHDDTRLTPTEAYIRSMFTARYLAEALRDPEYSEQIAGDIMRLHLTNLTDAMRDHGVAAH